MEVRAAQGSLAITLALALSILASACGGSTTTVTVTVAPPSPRVVPLVIGLRQALAVQKERDQLGESHKLLGIILLEMGAISSEQLIEILKKMNNAASGEGRIPGENGRARRRP